MTAQKSVTIQCHWCNGEGHYKNAALYPGMRVVCQTCWGSGTVDYLPNCDHMEANWDGYGDIDDPQWYGANQCDICDALFTLWPKVDW